MSSIAPHDRDQYQHVATEQGTDDPHDPSAYRDAERQARLSRVHLATVQEKKRLWWRNALITSGCIASWYVSFPFWQQRTFLTDASQVRVCYLAFPIQQVDVFTGPLWISIPTVCYMLSHVDPVHIGIVCSSCLAPEVPSSREANAKAIWVSRYPIYTLPSYASSESCRSQRVIPIAFATASDIGLGNTSLQTITLSFYSAFSALICVPCTLITILFQPWSKIHH